MKMLFHENTKIIKIQKIKKYKLFEFFCYVGRKFKNYFSKLRINRNEKSSKHREGDRHFHPYLYRS